MRAKAALLITGFWTLACSQPCAYDTGGYTGGPDNATIPGATWTCELEIAECENCGQVWLCCDDATYECGYAATDFDGNTLVWWPCMDEDCSSSGDAIGYCYS